MSNYNLYAIRKGSQAYRALKTIIANPGLQVFEIRKEVGLKCSRPIFKLKERGLVDQNSGLWYATKDGKKVAKQ